ncbi:thermonuclease family protein [Chitinophaga defluvii]|uniref:Thermonuclease family protein n=1 Tax=Chitinophaga defluvii TaxID=3163343 RepID=A0ABV2T9G5_9BACT
MRQALHNSSFLIILLLLIHVNAWCLHKDPVKVKGKVVKVIDGDTFELLTARKVSYRIRMSAIDAPERGQDFYKVSKDALGRQCFNKTVTVILLNKDQYQRWVGELYDDSGKNINLWMVEQGHAWHYKQYVNPALAAAEQKARIHKRGLWAHPAPIAPWEYRKAKRNKPAKKLTRKFIQ